MRYWTPERDEEMKRHEAAGLSAAKIAAQLGTTRGAILGRSNRLRGKVFKSDLERRPRRRSPASTAIGNADQLDNFAIVQHASAYAAYRELSLIAATKASARSPHHSASTDGGDSAE